MSADRVLQAFPAVYLILIGYVEFACLVSFGFYLEDVFPSIQ